MLSQQLFSHSNLYSTSWLQGTRQCLQNAVKDARALRRKQKEEYHRAKIQANLCRSKKRERDVLASAYDVEDGGSGGVPSSMLFRAMAPGNHKIGHDVECGFDESQLETLFPEELRSYKRWRKVSQIIVVVGEIKDSIKGLICEIN